jgi:hypothetical protein
VAGFDPPTFNQYSALESALLLLGRVPYFKNDFTPTWCRHVNAILLIPHRFCFCILFNSCPSFAVKSFHLFGCRKSLSLCKSQYCIFNPRQPPVEAIDRQGPKNSRREHTSCIEYILVEPICLRHLRQLRQLRSSIPEYR